MWLVVVVALPLLLHKNILRFIVPWPNFPQWSLSQKNTSQSSKVFIWLTYSSFSLFLLFSYDPRFVLRNSWEWHNIDLFSGGSRRYIGDEHVCRFVAYKLRCTFLLQYLSWLEYWRVSKISQSQLQSTSFWWQNTQYVFVWSHSFSL